jgi:hypothetical protein
MGLLYVAVQNDTKSPSSKTSEDPYAYSSYLLYKYSRYLQLDSQSRKMLLRVQIVTLEIGKDLKKAPE